MGITFGGTGEYDFEDNTDGTFDITHKPSGNTLTLDQGKIDSTEATTQLGIPQYSSDGNAPNNTVYINTTTSRLKHKDGSGNIINPAKTKAISESGSVAQGDFGIVDTVELGVDATIEIMEASFHEIGSSSPFVAASSGADLVIADGSSVKTNILSGDSSTIYINETSSPPPLDSYTNGNASAENIAIGIDNGQINTTAGKDIEAQADVLYRVV